MSRPTPQPQPQPVSPGAMLARQFVTLLLLMISLAISFTFLFVQTSTSAPTRHSTLLLVWSGMRPDMVSDALTPYLSNLGNNGIIATDQHATLLMPPSAAGAISAPTVTGAVAPTFTPTTTASPQGTPTPTITPTVAPTLPADTGTQALGALGDMTTLAQTALGAGLQLSYEGAGGTALLQALSHPTNTYILDDQTAYPATLAGQLQQADISLPMQLPPVTAATAPALPLTQSLTSAFLQVILPHLQATTAPFLSVIDFPDPAATAALTGIGSPALVQALQNDDAALGAILDGLNKANLLANTNIIVTSDHGLSDVVQPDNITATSQQFTAPTNAVRTDVAARLTQTAALGAKGTLPDVGKAGVSTGLVGPKTTVQLATAPGYDTITFPATAASLAVNQTTLLQEIVTFLQTTPQIGPIFVNDALGKPNGTLPLSTLFAVNAASPAILFGFETFAQDVGQRGTNIHQFAGSAYADTANLASWGSFSRRDLHTIFYAQGPNFKAAGQDIAPTGGDDIAPSIASLLSLTLPATVPGRAINEIIGTTSDNANAPTTSVVASQPQPLADGTQFYEVVVFEQFSGVTYLDGAYALHAQGTLTAAQLKTQAVALAEQE